MGSPCPGGSGRRAGPGSRPHAHRAPAWLPAPGRPRVRVSSDLSGSPVAQAALSVIAEPDAQLWWAAKELRRTKTLSDYVGRNEKTKIIVKIQQVSASACRFPFTFAPTHVKAP